MTAFDLFQKVFIYIQNILLDIAFHDSFLTGVKKKNPNESFATKNVPELNI